MQQKILFPLFIIATLIVSFFFFQKPSQKETVKSDIKTLDLAKKDATYKVNRVIDGDTIEIEGGYKVRYIGIDTPETVDPNKPIGCFGKEASKKNHELVEGKKVRLEKDVSTTDKYGRFLAYVYQDTNFINEILVKEGYAKASSYPPDVKYQQKFQEAEKIARQEEKGLWGSCGFVANVLTKENQNTSSINSSDCNIKGDISKDGQKIYYLEGQKEYSSVVIDENSGERWFCSEADAIQDSWLKSKL